MEYVSGLACVQAIAFTDAPPDGSELRTDSVAAINRCNEPVSTSVRLGSGGAFNGTTTVYHASDRGDWSSIHDLPPGYAHPWANGPLHPDIATARYEGPLVRLELLALSLTIVSVDKAMPPPPPSAPSLPPPPPAPPPQVPCVPCTNELPSGLAAQGRSCDWSWIVSNKCRHDSTWVSRKYCQLGCYNGGAGYEGDNCCPTAVGWPSPPSTPSPL